MKIMITGGSGFVARNLYESLHNQYQFLNPTRKNLDLLDSDNVFRFLKKNRFDVLIHTATYDAVAKGSTKDPAKVLESNLKMFFNLVKCRGYFGKMIYFGSGAEFDRPHWKPRMKEDYFDKYIPQDQYGFSKYIMTKYTELNSNIYNLRLFGVFGKYDDWQTRLIPNLCCRAVHNLPINIEQNKYRDFLYVGDLVKIVRWFIEHKPKNKTYNVCTGKVQEFKSIAKKIIEISGKRLRLKIEKRGWGQEYSGDNARLLNEIKNFKFTSFDQSLRSLYDWYNLNKDIIEKEKL